MNQRMEVKCFWDFETNMIEIIPNYPDMNGFRVFDVDVINLLASENERLTAKNEALKAELQRYRELEQLPSKIWRVIVNKKSNDWNNEPEYSILEYSVFAYDKQANKYWVETPGWTGFKRRHWLNNKDLHFTLEEAQSALAERMEDK